MIAARFEPLIRAESAPDDAVVVIRGAPVAAEKIVEHAVRQQALFTYLGQPMMAISVYLAVSGWTVDSILRERMRTRSRYPDTSCIGVPSRVSIRRA